MKDSAISSPPKAHATCRAFLVYCVLAVCLWGAGARALAATVTEANEAKFLAALPSGSVTLNFSGTLSLTAEQVIASDTFIEDLSGTSRLSGKGTNRLFRVLPGATLTLRNLALTNGVALGLAGTNGAAGKAGTSGDDALGGAVYIEEGGTLVATGARFSSHRALGGAGGAGGAAPDVGTAGGLGGNGGKALGGALYCLGSLRLTNCIFENSFCQAGTGGAGGGGSGVEDGGNGGNGGLAAGGAIYAGPDTVVLLSQCRFDGNASTGALAGAAGTGPGSFSSSGLPGISGAALGGAIAADHSSSTLLLCTFEDNQVLGTDGVDGPTGAATQSNASGRNGTVGAGGAVHLNAGSLQAEQCSFFQNAAVAGSGGAGGLTFIGDGGHGGNGAAALGGAMTLTNGVVASLVACSLDNNEAVAGAGAPGSLGQDGFTPYDGSDGAAGAAEGGAIFQAAGTLALVATTLANNLCTGIEGVEGAPGHQGSRGYTGNTGGNASGAGVCVRAGSVAATNSTFYGNQATGGAGGAGGVGDPSGLSTDGGNGGTGGRAEGAGLFLATPGLSWVVNCTFATNEVTGGAGGAGGAAGSDAARAGATGSQGVAIGGALSGSTNLHLINTLLAYSGSAANVSGKVTDDGGNLSSDATPTLGAGRNHQDPQLQPLMDNGGLTTTTMPAGTNCIDRGVVAGAPLTDQRGVSRAGLPDVGAVEPVGPTLSISRGSNYVVLSWVATNISFGLQRSTQLPAWSARATNATASGVVSVTNTTAAAREFYRLSR